jgi:hypothetical protein
VQDTAAEFERDSGGIAAAAATEAGPEADSDSISDMDFVTRGANGGSAMANGIDVDIGAAPSASEEARSDEPRVGALSSGGGGLSFSSRAACDREWFVSMVSVGGGAMGADGADDAVSSGADDFDLAPGDNARNADSEATEFAARAESLPIKNSEELASAAEIEARNDLGVFARVGVDSGAGIDAVSA